MREIKYRAVHTLTKHWFDEDEIIFAHGKWFEDGRAYEDYRPLNMEQCAVMQYTGLKDKNGVEIYEGDIIENTSEMVSIFGEKSGKQKVSRCRIGWHEEGLWNSFSDMSNHHIGLRGVYSPEIYSVVIGNIFDNPGLLERDSHD